MKKLFKVTNRNHETYSIIANSIDEAINIYDKSHVDKRDSHHPVIKVEELEILIQYKGSEV